MIQRRIILRLPLALAAAGASHAVAQPGRPRIALVIGNGGYRGVPALPNPPRDARAMALALERLRFQVDLLLDADRDAMAAAVGRLGRAANGAEAALLFYAGHAAELSGRNLLLPVSVARPRHGAELERQAITYDEVQAAIAGRAETTLVLLDSCRDNPFAGLPTASDSARRPSRSGAPEGSRSLGSGLAGVVSPSGMLIAFATAPGEVALDGAGSHSPFTAALLQHIETPDVEIRDMLTRVRRSVLQATGGRQVPWDNSSLSRPFFFRLSASAARPAGPTPRILQEAASHGIPLPPGLVEERFRRPPNGGPNADLVGSWSSGDRRWAGRSGRRNVLIVLSVDEAARVANVIFAQSAFSADPGVQARPASHAAPAYFRRRQMALGPEPGSLSWRDDRSEMRFRLLSSDVMFATYTEGERTGRAEVRMVRVD